MRQIIIKISRTIDCTNRIIGKSASWAIVVAILISASNALSRRFFGITSNAWLELQWYLFGAVFMLCVAWVLQENEHVRIDVLSSNLSERSRVIIDIVGHVFFLFPFVAVMLWLSTQFLWNALLSGELSPNEGGLPLWPAKTLIFVGFAQLALQWMSELVKSVVSLRTVSAHCES